MRALVVNAGSTSLKVTLTDQNGETRVLGTLAEALALGERADAVVHRVVHGGERPAPALIDDQLVAELESLADLAPLHQTRALDLIAETRGACPTLPHFAVFDTSFHTTVPAAAHTYAIPERWRRQVRGYGFHGIAHGWSARRIADVAPGARRVVIAHLGGGASLCAVYEGRSVMTTMGFTPLDGLVMATRSGSLDPGAVLWLDRHSGEDVLEVLEHESGLLGLCGDADMPAVLRRGDEGDTTAVLALDVYVHRLVTSIGACVAGLGGIDALVFTGGVGEGSSRIRELVGARLTWLGVELAQRAVGDDVTELTADGAAVRTFVVRAREDLEMVRLVAPLLPS